MQKQRIKTLGQLNFIKTSEKQEDLIKKVLDSLRKTLNSYNWYDPNQLNDPNFKIAIREINKILQGETNES